MPVIGIDFGSHEIIITSIIKGKVCVIKDKNSEDKHPPIVLFKKGLRYVCGEAMSQSRNDMSCFAKFNKKSFAVPGHLISKEYHKQITLIPDAENSEKFEAKHGNEKFLISSIDIAYMLFKHCYDVARSNYPSNTKFDCVVSIPGYFSMAQRSAMMNCAAAAGFYDVKAINDTTLAALCHSFYDFEAEEGAEKYDIVVVDFSYSGFQMSLCEIKKGFVKEICYNYYDLSLSTFNTLLVDCIFEKFIADNDHLPENKRKEIYAFIHQRIDKHKETLMGGIGIKFASEYQGNHIDISISCSDLFDKYESINVDFRKHVNEFVNCEAVKSRDIKFCLPCGSGTRIEAVTDHISRSLNARMFLKSSSETLTPFGAALCAGILSSSIRVTREVKLFSSILLPIEIIWSSLDSNQASVELFKIGEVFPSTHAVTFKSKTKNFEFSIQYKHQHPLQANKQLAHVQMKNLPINPDVDGGILTMKATISLDVSGLIQVTSITYETKKEFKIQEEVPDETPEIPVEENPKKDETDTKSEEPGQEQNEEGSKADQEDSKKEEQESKDEPKINSEEKTKKKKTKLVDKVIVRNVREELKFCVSYDYELIKPADILDNEKQINKIDLETRAKTLAREDMFKINCRCTNLLENEEEKQFIADIKQIEEIENDSDYQSAQQVARIDLEKTTKLLKEYHDVLNAIEERIKESKERNFVVDDFRSSLEFAKDSLSNICNKKEEFSHILDSEIEDLKKFIEYYDNWLTSVLKDINNSPKSENPPHRNGDIVAGKKALLEKIIPIINKPIPAPETKEEDCKDPNQEEEQQADEGEDIIPETNGNNVPNESQVEDQ
ncbi:MAG: Heat shock 70 kDa protein 4L, variant 2 [Marteilia pararefringens]